jgi:hypothetical protein
MQLFDGITHDRIFFGTIGMRAEFADSHGGAMDAPAYIPCGSIDKIEADERCNAFYFPSRAHREFM